MSEGGYFHVGTSFESSSLSNTACDAVNAFYLFANHFSKSFVISETMQRTARKKVISQMYLFSSFQRIYHKAGISVIENCVL